MEPAHRQAHRGPTTDLRARAYLSSGCLPGRRGASLSNTGVSRKMSGLSLVVTRRVVPLEVASKSRSRLRRSRAELLAVRRRRRGTRHAELVGPRPSRRVENRSGSRSRIRFDICSLTSESSSRRARNSGRTRKRSARSPPRTSPPQASARSPATGHAADPSARAAGAAAVGFRVVADHPRACERLAGPVGGLGEDPRGRLMHCARSETHDSGHVPVKSVSRNFSSC